jgi:succinate dehydrogenase hydrophobic anchor subunit
LQNQPPPPLPTGGTYDTRASDLSALSNVIVAAILNLAGVIVSLVAAFGTSAWQLFTVTTNSSGTTTFTANQSNLSVFVGVVATAVILTFLELIFFRLAFVDLGRIDSRFSTPGTLVLLMLVALPILLFALLGLVYVLEQAITCAGSVNPITSACLDMGTFLAIAAVLGITAILLLVGYIGLLIGIWRLGSRYSSDGFKVGAVLLIFPVLSIAGVVLILVSARSARERIMAGGFNPLFA